MTILNGTRALGNLISTLAGLFRLSEEDRIRAGIFLGKEEASSGIERHAFPALEGEDLNPCVGQESR